MLAALFFWALLYRLVPVLRQGTMEKTELLRAISDVFCWRHEQHLYYLHILLLVYAALPVTRAFAAKADEKTVRYALALWGITGVFFPTLRALGLFSRIEGIPKQWALNLAWASIGCTVLGWFLRKHPMRVGASIGCFVSGFFLCFAGTALFVDESGGSCPCSCSRGSRRARYSWRRGFFACAERWRRSFCAGFKKSQRRAGRPRSASILCTSLRCMR